MSQTKLTPFLLQRIILFLVLLASPYAMTFTPYERIYTEGVWNTPFDSDPLYLLRAGLITAGWLAGFLSFVSLVWGLSQRNWKGRDLVLEASITLCSLSIGWAAFPYWINGLFQAYSGNAQVVDFDPKALIPTVWMGGIWYLGVLAIYLCVCIVSPILLLINFVLFEKRFWKQCVATSICLTISAAIFFLSPNYLRWLAD